MLHEQHDLKRNYEKNVHKLETTTAADPHKRESKLYLLFK
jgi:hypothetical protein